jgi:hypothetical protein
MFIKPGCGLARMLIFIGSFILENPDGKVAKIWISEDIIKPLIWKQRKGKVRVRCEVAAPL